MNQKKAAGEKAIEFVRDGMTIGLGTGSTVYWTIKGLGQIVREGLRLTAVPTAAATAKLMNEFGIPHADLAEVETLDLTIDGADEISPELDLIKGGGGALFREKLVAEASRAMIVVADESKLVPVLGKFPLPLEIVPFGWARTARLVEDMGITVKLRMTENKAFITDNGNHILDCACGPIKDPAELHTKLKTLTGVVETGLFFHMPIVAVVAGENGIEILKPGGVNT
jgi:ribose 5-phosphate isomerase A